MERLILFEPGYDKRNIDPVKNYDIHGMNLRFVLKGSLGAVQFLIYTNWHPKLLRDELFYGPQRYNIFEPMGADVGYHSLKPMYDGHQPIDDNCPYTGGNCYYDGSSSRAEELLEKFLINGVEIVWAALEQYYLESLEDTDGKNI